MQTKFYVFSQNNSGGSFVVDDKLCHRLFIEATDEGEAVRIAESMGVYFNGCAQGIDCSCCGDRWYYPDEITMPQPYGTYTKDEAEKISEKYDITKEAVKPTYRNRDTAIKFNTIESYAQYLADNFGWEAPDARIFYKNGEVKEIVGKIRL